eukprot:1159167-Pelagomonas_calceolata.AAC.3
MPVLPWGRTCCSSDGERLFRSPPNYGGRLAAALAALGRLRRECVGARNPDPGEGMPGSACAARMPAKVSGTGQA